MPYKIGFHPEAEKDFEALDGAVRKEVSKKIDILAKNPFLGKPLGNKFGINSTGFYKLYVSKKNYRIVYRLLGEHIEVVEIVGIFCLWMSQSCRRMTNKRPIGRYFMSIN